MSARARIGPKWSGRYRGGAQKHTVIAERALGKVLPVGAQVHHVNGDGFDNRHSNLVICQDAAYHKLLHVRARIVRAGGNPNTQRICCGPCKSLHLMSGMYGSQRRGFRCLDCHREMRREGMRRQRANRGDAINARARELRRLNPERYRDYDRKKRAQENAR